MRQKTGRKDFQSHIAFEVLIVGAINFAHASSPKFLQHNIVTECLADHLGVCLGRYFTLS